MTFEYPLINTVQNEIFVYAHSLFCETLILNLLCFVYISVRITALSSH